MGYQSKQIHSLLQAFDTGWQASLVVNKQHTITTEILTTDI